MPGYTEGKQLVRPKEPDTFVVDPDTQEGEEALDQINKKIRDEITFGLKVIWSATGPGGKLKETYETSGALGK